MKPLEKTKLRNFLERFENFKDCEFRSFEILNPVTFKLTFGVQDKAREFNWISLELEFNGVNDARLLKEKKMSLVDMSDGVSIVLNNNNFGFGIGICENISCITNSSYYIICDTIKYKEGDF